jgi:hypothetical protein
MRTFLASLTLFSCALTLNGADVYPELKTLDGKSYHQVKVMKVAPTEIRVMHSDGFATIPLSELPPEVRAKYGVADTAAEAANAQARQQANSQAAMMQRQEKEAVQLIDLTGLPLQTLKQAIVTRDWCQANPSGGLLNGATVSVAERTEMLAQAMTALNTRRNAPADAPPPTPPMPGTGAPPVAAMPPAGAVPAAPLPGFVPGVIQLLSARYSLPNEAARNVKNRFAKLVPSGVIHAPVSIQVTDQLSDAALDQGNSTVATGAGVAVTNGTVTVGVAKVVTQEQGRNTLTVEYMYNGQRYKKQAIEGSYIVLP